MNIRHLTIASTLLALNIILAKGAALLSLPVYLDTIGTILAAVLLPLRYAFGVAALTSAVGSFVIHPAFGYYVLTQVSVCGVASVAIKHNLFSSTAKSTLAGTAIALTAAIVSSPVTVIVFGGVTLSSTTGINAVLLAAGNNLWQSVIAGALFIESIDKITVCIMVSLLLSRLPERLTKNA